jgi:flotillin
VKGEAEAFAIEAKAKAEAEQMAKKADAWKEYCEAAVVDMVLETMPKVLYLCLHCWLLYLPGC